MNQFSRLKEFLSLQLTSKRFKKSDLIQVYHKLGFNFGEAISNCKKHELAEAISTLLLQEMDAKWKKLACTQLTAQEQVKEINKQLQAKLQVFNLGGLSISKKIYDIFNLETLSHTNQMSSNRQIKVYQESVENIWITETKQIQCLCPKAPSNLQQPKKIESCYRCFQKYHSQCFWSPQKGQDIFECPFCYLKFCMPQKQVKQILFGGYLPIMKKQKVQYKINFSLNPKTKADKSVILQARCIKFNSKNRYQISWPDSCAFSLGKNRISEFKPLPTSSPLKRRADQPIKLDKSRLLIDNQIIIQQRSTSQTGYKLNKKCYHLVVIMVVSELPNQMVLSKMQKSFLPVQQSKQQLTRYMSHDKSDVLIEKIAISLRCQYFGSKMKLPARSRLCNTHFQPFDLMNFITSSIHAKNSAKRWKCPICDKRAYDLVIDKYILELMKENPNVNEIVFRENGEHQMIQAKEDSVEQGNESDGEGGRAFYEYEKKQKDKANVIINIDEQQEEQAEKAIANIQKQPIISQTQKEKVPAGVIGRIPDSMIIESEQQEQKKQRQKQKQKGRRQNNEQRKQKDDVLRNSSLNKMSSNVSGIGEKKNSQSQRFQNQGVELKKIRKLNNGNLQISVKGKRNQITKAIQNEPVLISSDEDQPVKPKVNKNQDNNPNQSTLKKTVKEPKHSLTAPKPSTATATQPQKPASDPKQPLRQNSSQAPPAQPIQKAAQPISLPSNLQLIIDIDSQENEEPMQQALNKSIEQINKELHEQILTLNRTFEKQGKMEITQQDTDLFQILYNKFVTRCE